MRMNLFFSLPSAPPVERSAKLSVSESAAMALNDPAILAELKALLVEKALSKQSPQQLANIAITSLAVAGAATGNALAHVGAVTGAAVQNTAHIVLDAEKYAESVLGKCTTGVGKVLGAVTGVFNPLIPEAANQPAPVVDVVASQIRAACLLASKAVNRTDNQLAKLFLLELERKADDAARHLIKKGKKL